MRYIGIGLVFPIYGGADLITSKSPAGELPANPQARPKERVTLCQQPCVSSGCCARRGRLPLAPELPSQQGRSNARGHGKRML